MSGLRGQGRRKREMIRRVRNAGYFCTLCGHKIPDHRKTGEHIIPRSAGGSNHRANLTMSCYDCNTARGSKTYVLPKFHVTTGELLRPDEVRKIMRAAQSVSRPRWDAPEANRSDDMQNALEENATFVCAECNER